MKVKCVENNFESHLDPEFTVGKVYEMRDDGCIIGDDDCNWWLDDDYCYSGRPDMAKFEPVTESGNNRREVEPGINQTESVQIATLRSIQEQCSRANLSISIDPEGFNIFDCDTDMQTMVHSVAEVIEILETKIEYRDYMGKWGWL